MALVLAVDKVARRFCPDSDGILRSLFVAWKLGDEILFALRLGEITLRARVDEEGRLTYKAHLPARKKTEDILSDEEDRKLYYYINLKPSEKEAILTDESHLGPLNVLGKFDLRSQFCMPRMGKPMLPLVGCHIFNSRDFTHRPHYPRSRGVGSADQTICFLLWREPSAARELGL